MQAQSGNAHLLARKGEQLLRRWQPPLGTIALGSNAVLMQLHRRIPVRPPVVRVMQGQAAGPCKNSESCTYSKQGGLQERERHALEETNMRVWLRAGVLCAAAMMSTAGRVLTARIDVLQLAFYTAPVSSAVLAPFFWALEKDRFLAYAAGNGAAVATIVLCGSMVALAYNVIHNLLLQRTSSVAVKSDVQTQAWTAQIDGCTVEQTPFLVITLVHEQCHAGMPAA